VRHTARIRQVAQILPQGPNTPGRRRPTTRQVGPGLPFGGLLLTGLLLAGLLLAGCGDPPPVGTTAPAPAPPDASSAAAAPATPPPAAPSPDPSDATDPDEAVQLPWPAADQSAVEELQRSVDEGSEPWLLDPAEVAVSYANAAHGWSGAVARPRPDGRTVDVAEGDRRLTLSLTQPGRPGAGGIWVVTAESPG
jgi:hypothetical protein